MIYSNQPFMMFSHSELLPNLQLASNHLPYPSYLQQLLTQAENLKSQNLLLQRQLTQVLQENELVKSENLELREELNKGSLKIKRRYRKRRTHLQKKFVCEFENCGLKYSSKVALNSHLRKKHQYEPFACL